MIDTDLDPRVLVTSVDMMVLIEAVLGDGHSFAIIEDEDGDIRFACPKCGRINSNGGTAEVLNGWSWRCRPCRFSGTRVMFERMVLEDADAMARFFRLVADDEAAL